MTDRNRDAVSIAQMSAWMRSFQRRQVGPLLPPPSARINSLPRSRGSASVPSAHHHRLMRFDRELRQYRARFRRKSLRSSLSDRIFHTESPFPQPWSGSRGRSPGAGFCSRQAPPLLNCPTSSFFLVSTLTTGFPARRESLSSSGDVEHLFIAVRGGGRRRSSCGWRATSSASSRSNRPTVLALT